jgi:hypothetical protein
VPDVRSLAERRVDLGVMRRAGDEERRAVVREDVARERRVARVDDRRPEVELERRVADGEHHDGRRPR